mgnify:CR=1 FL=1|tara:strand:+ start:3470 stop:3733 length:264 start_codon:yes stop_codon:yes gene_type:complete
MNSITLDRKIKDCQLNNIILESQLSDELILLKNRMLDLEYVNYKIRNTEKRLFDMKYTSQSKYLDKVLSNEQIENVKVILETERNVI